MSDIPVMLAKEYEPGKAIKNDTTGFAEPPLGWKASEKFDGYRALFRYLVLGGVVTPKFYSRQGNEFTPPQWFLDAMPSYKILGDKILDGELWAGKENFQMMGVVRKKVPQQKKKPVMRTKTKDAKKTAAYEKKVQKWEKDHQEKMDAWAKEWNKIEYHVYDIVNGEGHFSQRLKELESITDKHSKDWSKKAAKIDFPETVDKRCRVVLTEQHTITSLEQMKQLYEGLLKQGAEGIMLKHPESPYEGKRSSYMQKYKPAFDREAMIIDYKLGDGKYTGLLGSFVCQPLINHDTYMSVDPDPSKIFTLSGMDDEIRNNYQKTHPVGTIITFECSGFTDKGIPRHPRYLRIRDDVVLKDPPPPNKPKKRTSKNSSGSLEPQPESSDEKLQLVKQIMSALLKYYKDTFNNQKIVTYHKILRGLGELSSDAELTTERLSQIKGIGKGTITRIQEILATGTLQDYEKIKDYKSPYEEFAKIHGVGPKHAKKLVDAGFNTVEDLRKAPDLKKYLNDTQRKGLEHFDDIQKRIPYEEIKLHERLLKRVLKKVDPKAELTIAGSYRRKKPDSGDIDLLIKADDKSTYVKFIEALTEMKYLVTELALGDKKYMGLGRIKDDLPCRRVDIMYTTPEQYPFAILYFTGSKNFNEMMRGNALKMGFTMNEYEMKDKATKSPPDKVFLKEQDIFKFFQSKIKSEIDKVQGVVKSAAKEKKAAETLLSNLQEMHKSFTYVKPEER
tara:strand:+ start:70 stop:2262 length:2193 start_codon:yes stop_codon:yes gene_type:complete